MPNPPPTDLRRHRALTDRNLLIGFFVVLALAGGGLIVLVYDWSAGVTGLLCFAMAAVLVGIVMLIMFGLERLSKWLDREDQ